MSEDTIVELYGKELLAVHSALEEMLLTRVPRGYKHIRSFLNRPDVKHAIECYKEDKEW